MSMTESEKRAHAERLIRWNVEDPEFCWVYEDDDLADADEGDQRAIHDLMRQAKITVHLPAATEGATR